MEHFLVPEIKEVPKTEQDITYVRDIRTHLTGCHLPNLGQYEH